MAMLFYNLMAMMRKPFYIPAGVFPAGQDLSWIPDAGSNIPMYAAVETPNGSQKTFTFASIPKAVLWNGVWYLENYGYVRNGFTIMFTNTDGTILTPEANAVIRA